MSDIDYEEMRALNSTIQLSDKEANELMRGTLGDKYDEGMTHVLMWTRRMLKKGRNNVDNIIRRLPNGAMIGWAVQAACYDLTRE